MTAKTSGDTDGESPTVEQAYRLALAAFSIAISIILTPSLLVLSVAAFESGVGADFSETFLFVTGSWLVLAIISAVVYIIMKVRGKYTIQIGSKTD